MRVDTAGRLLLGLTSSDVSGVGVISEDFMAAVSAASSAVVLSLSALDTSTAIASNKTGSHGYVPLVFYTNAGERLRIEAASPYTVRFSSNATVMADATYDVGEPSARWQNIYGNYIDAKNYFLVNGNAGMTTSVTIGGVTLSFTGGILTSVSY
jgi:hypothetical protein